MSLSNSRGKSEETPKKKAAPSKIRSPRTKKTPATKRPTAKKTATRVKSETKSAETDKANEPQEAKAEATRARPKPANKKTAKINTSRKAKPKEAKKNHKKQYEQKSANSGKSKKSRNAKEPKSKHLSSEALRIVEQAASILEEEISAGIIAAKKVEERYVNINALRSGDPEHVMQRFRKDAHEVLDIVLDMVNLSITSMAGLGERAMNIRNTAESATQPENSPANNVLSISLPSPLKPGENSSIAILVENESDQNTGVFSLTSSSFIGPHAKRLSPACVQFEPSEIEIPAKDLQKVEVRVSVPKRAAAGEYSGLLHAANVNMRVMLSFLVEK